MKMNSLVWVIFPDETGSPILKRRRLATEIAEYGMTRLVYDTKEEAEMLFYQPQFLDDLTALWKLNTIARRASVENLMILADVARALESGKVVTIKGRPLDDHVIECVAQFRKGETKL